MLHYKILARTIGILLFVEAMMMLLCCGVALFYKEQDVYTFAYSFLITTGVSIALRIVGRHSGNSLNRRESFFIVATTWMDFSILGMIPFLWGGYCPTVADAFFETMSGFTSTGSSVITDVERCSHAILFWRSLSQWVGGLGIVFFTLAFLPSGGKGENGIRLFAAESTGLTREKIHPRISTTVKWLFSLYVALTLLCAVCLWGCGMSIFDSINHAMATTSTGGFSTRNLGIRFYNSAAIEYVITVFMFLSGVSFYLLYTTFHRHSLLPLRQSGEFRFYLTSVVVISVVSGVSLIINSGYTVEHAVRSALFNVVSLHTSTGFVSDNFQLWWHPIWFFLFFAMITGACAGSTSGGIKCIRMDTLVKTAINQFQHLLHPQLFRPVRIGSRTITPALEQALLAFVFWYIVSLFGGTILLSVQHISFLDSLSIAVSCLGNVGATDGTIFSPINNLYALPHFGKWVCSFLMLAGRLELFPVLLPLLPAFWKKN